MAEEGKSVGWVAAMLGLAVAYFGWTFLAADYFQNDPTGGGGKINVWVNSVAQIPHLFDVVGHAFRDRLWMVGLIIGLEVVVLFLWRVMKKLERELSR